MDFSYAVAISASGMDVERTRLDVSALNLANVHTSRTAEGGVFKPMRVVAGAGPVAPFSNAVASIGEVPGARVVDIHRIDVPPRMAFEPGHPDADAQGFVAYPGVDTTVEMVNLMTAVRSYEANVIAMNAAKAMATKALEIGGGQ